METEQKVYQSGFSDAGLPDDCVSARSFDVEICLCQHRSILIIPKRNVFHGDAVDVHGICTAGNGFLLGGVDIENELQSLYAGYCLIPKNASVALMTGDTMDMNTTRK